MTTTLSNTATITMTPITSGGFPNNVDEKYLNAVTTAMAGGDSLQKFFDSMNQTADFWSYMASNAGDNENPFSPGETPQGDPIVMASSGNVDMRVGTFYTGDSPSAMLAEGEDGPPVHGILSIETGETTYGLSKTLSTGLSIAGLPPGVILSKKLFADLVKPVYKNAKVAITKLAKKFKESSEVEDPSIDPQSDAEDALSDASSDTEEVVGELAEDGVEYASIEWGSVALEFAGIGALAAIPIIVGFLGHKMVVSMTIINFTNSDFDWNIAYQAHGSTSVKPGGTKVIPKMNYVTDQWGDKTTVKNAYEANFQFINSTNLGSIGDLITLAPSSGGDLANLALSIPWAGENTIWVGASGSSPEETYEQNTMVPNKKLTVTASFGTYQVSMAITKLEGETKDQYFYGILATIKPLG